MNKIRKLLVIDDSAYICCQIEQIFKYEDDLKLVSANSGEEALAKVRSFMPDLILLDVVLPDVEGYDLYHQIKAIDKNNAIIIFLTSKDQDSDIVKGFSLGASDYIKKPFHNEILKSRILAHLNEKQIKDQLRRENEEMEAHMKKLNSMAFRDTLTGLYNRRYVEEQLKGLIMKEDKQVALLMCDVDNFKHINDLYGHEIGDVVLIGIANIIGSAHPDIHAIRWGGEEFLICLFNMDKELILSISEQIENFARFTSSIWQVHPFGEGNTRTTAVFMQKYLMAKGYNTNNEIFKSNSLYFRNALVRSNYENAAKRVFVNFDYLITFYRNLIIGENIEMHSRELIAYELFEKQDDTRN